jgi:N-acetylglucosamine kinase-like BadF-type ATPase
VERRLPSERVKELAPLLFLVAAGGDPIACRIVSEFAAGMAELVTAGLVRFAMTGLSLEVVVSGSIFKARGTGLLDEMEAGIRKVAPLARLVNARYEPVAGALLLGLEALGGKLDGEVEANIEAGCRELGLIRI